MQRGLPPIDLRPKWSHLLLFLDVLIVVALFRVVGKMYMENEGSVLLAQKAEERTAVEIQAKRSAAQAESLVAVTLSQLEEMRADSARAASELEARRLALQAEMKERDLLSETAFQLSDRVWEMRQQSESAVRKADEYEEVLVGREQEVAQFVAQAETSEARLAEAKQELDQTTRELVVARERTTYEPVSRLPSSAGVLFRREARDEGGLTGVELQKTFWNQGVNDLGFSAGFGLGDGEVESEKKLGLLLSRSLIHRRLGLDLSAGYSVLTNPTGGDDQGAYASAGLRYSPFYKERFHFGIGAKADPDGVQPYIGIGLGRR